MRLLPLFPLKLVAFPGEKLNLHIFEPRYRELVRDCLAGGLTFGIPPYLEDAVQELGTEMRLLSVERVHPGGEMDIRTEGLGVFRVEQFWRQAPGKLYAAGRVEDVAQDDTTDPALGQVLDGLVRRLYDVLGLHERRLALQPGFRVWEVAHYVGLSTEQEYQLLGTTAEHERQELVREHLERLLPAVLETERLKERVRQNGHFKHLKPPRF